MEIRTTGDKTGRVGALIYFSETDIISGETITAKDVKNFLAELAACGLIPGIERMADNIDSVTIGTYNPEYGGPVWYIP